LEAVLAEIHPRDFQVEQLRIKRVLQCHREQEAPPGQAVEVDVVAITKFPNICYTVGELLSPSE
jgi:hypothetical protein